MSEIKQIIAHEKGDDQFLKIFQIIAKNQREEIHQNPIKRICEEGYEELTYRIDLSRIQESCSVRNVLRTRKIAQLLIKQEGGLNKEILSLLIDELKENIYSLVPDRQYDGVRNEHILFILQQLHSNHKLRQNLLSISMPMGHPLAEQIIRDTLQISTHIKLTDIHARQAALSALLCYLRQSVGSCFGTAPAIIIHNEQPEQFLKDISDLLATGRLIRTYGGVEYAVPLSTSWGAGDLKKQFYLPRDLSQVQHGIWNSPGFINALKAADLIDPDMPSRKKQQRAKELVAEAIMTGENSGDYCVLTIEKILKKILLNFIRISEKDLEEYSNRPLDMIRSGLLIQNVTPSQKSKSKENLCFQFINLFEKAKKHFKSLADNALLKAWEFTLASFVDTQATLSSWNLYSSLGFKHDEVGGIGPCLYAIIKEKLDQANAKVAEYQSEYEQLYVQIKYLESRIKSASTEKEVQWIKVEYQSKANEFRLLEELRNKTHNQAGRLAHLYEHLVDIYYHLIPKFFQEVYDAEMQDAPAGGQYDDSPAGFRLLYKHGRANTSQWTLIYTPQEYIQSLTSFFITTENEISFDPHLENLREELAEIVTRIVNHITTPQFIETAFYRIARAHQVAAIKNPLEHLDKIEKKPWAYTSGGSMDNLLSCYYRREEKPTVTSRWVESEIELLVFLLDCLKQIPYKVQEEFLKNNKKSLLMHSPTHAFLLKPSFTPFANGWQTDAFTYVWVRDQLVQPMKEFVEDVLLNEQMIAEIVITILKNVPENYHDQFKHVVLKNSSKNITTKDFHNFMTEEIARKSFFSSGYHWISINDIDAALFSLLPFFPGHQLRERLEKILESISEVGLELKEEILKNYNEWIQEEMSTEIISAKKLLNICKLLLSLTLQKTTTPYDFHLLITNAMRQLGYAIPSPIIFADSNWVKDLFGFIVNPGTGMLEFWRMDYAGHQAVPMNMWKEWLNGSRRDREWGIYIRPYEYTPYL